MKKSKRVEILERALALVYDEFEKAEATIGDACELFEMPGPCWAENSEVASAMRVLARMLAGRRGWRRFDVETRVRIPDRDAEMVLTPDVEICAWSREALDVRRLEGGA